MKQVLIVDTRSPLFYFSKMTVLMKVGNQLIKIPIFRKLFDKLFRGILHEMFKSVYENRYVIGYFPIMNI